MPPDAHPQLRRRLIALGLIMLALLLLTLAWNWGPLRAGLDIPQVVAALRRAGEHYGPLAAIAVFALASILAVPLVFLTLVSLVTLGPWLGALTILAGGTLGSTVSFTLGKRLGAEALRHLAGERINRISERLGRRGILAAAALRLVPIAPFAIVNMVAGTSHIRLRDFLIGSALGMTPGTLFFALFVEQMMEAFENPGPTSLGLFAATLILIAAGVWIAMKWVKNHT
jgi:uncharacterized membrane protein YdjX (TVP38/TMEM64 family)